MKTLRANTQTGRVVYEELKSSYQGFGNRGLVARVALDEIPATCDALGPDNKLIIAQSLLAGTVLSTSGRMSIGGKSPLTGGVKESNVGGMAGKALTAHGIQLLIVEGAPDKKTAYILLITSDGSGGLIERPELLGVGTFALVDLLRKDYGESCELLVCGPAGERRFKNACIMATDFSTKEPCRAAGRGGLGAVMGARGLRAIVVQRAGRACKASPARPEEFRAAMAALHKAASASSVIQARTKYGTFGGVRRNEETGILPVKNFRSMRFDGIDKIDAQAVVDQIDKNGGKYGLSCQSGCFIKCSNYYVNEGGRHTASAFNYETLGLCGPNCLIDSLDDVAEIKQTCDDFGIDTIEMGAALGVMMEAGVLPWGDGAAALAMTRQVAAGGQYSQQVALGLGALGEFLGVDRVPSVRGQALAAYDVRGNKGMGLSYLAGTMGADHTVGSGNPDKDGSYVASAIYMQNLLTAFDNIFCLFLVQPILMDKAIQASFFELLSAYFGEPWDMARLLKLGADTLAYEYRFNEAAGIGEAVMPQMFTDETSMISGSAYDIDGEQAARIKAAYLGAARP